MMYSLCPVCGAGQLRQQAQSVDLPKALSQWEAAMGVNFPRTVWQQMEATGHASLFECDRCGFGTFVPSVSGSADFYRTITANQYYNASKWEFDRAIRRILNVGARSVLDVGCGSGSFLRALRERAPSLRLAGAELDSDLLHQVQSDGFDTVALDESALEKQLRFDVVCSFQTLEHVEDPVTFLRSCIAFLRPGGELIVSTPDQDGPIQQFAEALTEVPPHHLTRWTRSAFEALLPRIGLECVAVQKEPLPAYLLDSYLQAGWSDGNWVSEVLGPLAQALGEAPLSFAFACLQESGLPHFHEMSGHTVIVVGRAGRH